MINEGQGIVEVIRSDMAQIKGLMEVISSNYLGGTGITYRKGSLEQVSNGRLGEVQNWLQENEYRDITKEKKPSEEEADRWLDGIQFILDMAGMVPGVGIVCDGINGFVYHCRGDDAAAALSFGAMIPIIGDAVVGLGVIGAKGYKIVKGIGKYGDDITKVALKYGDDFYVGVEKTVKGASEAKYEITWGENISPTQEIIPNTNIPKSFALKGTNVNGKEVWGSWKCE